MIDGIIGVVKACVFFGCCIVGATNIIEKLEIDEF